MEDKQVTEFLILTGTVIEFEFRGVVDGFPFDETDNLPHNHFKVRLIRGDKQYRFDFYDSYSNFRSGKSPSQYDVLASLEKYDVGDMADFVDEFGYVIKDRKSFLKVEKIWHACKSQYRELTNMYTPEEMDRLREIC